VLTSFGLIVSLVLVAAEGIDYGASSNSGRGRLNLSKLRWIEMSPSGTKPKFGPMSATKQVCDLPAYALARASCRVGYVWLGGYWEVRGSPK
jgi:hypothetical protein